MKVVFVEGYPGFRGAQRSLAALVVGLPEEVEAEILCTVAGRAADGYAAAGLAVEVFEVPALLRAFGGELTRRRLGAKMDAAVRGLLPYSLRLWQKWLRDRPDIVHCNQARALLLAAPAARLLGIPTVWHLRGLLDFGGLPRRLCFALADRIVCVSQEVAESLPEGVRRRAEVVYNGISAHLRPETLPAVREALATAKRDRGLDPSATVLLTASSFLPYKGLHHLVEAVDQLCERRPELRRTLLWVALGDSEGDPHRRRYQDELIERLDRANLATNIFWAEWRADVLAWIEAADVTVLPSVDREIFRYQDGTEVEAVCSEGFPRTVLESMASGTVVVASNVAGVGELLSEQNSSGLIVPPGDAEALAQAIEHLHDDSALRAALREAAADRVGQFSVERAVRDILSIYAELLASSRSDGRPGAGSIIG